MFKFVDLINRDLSWLSTLDITLSMVFPVVMDECESWTIKKAERWRIDAFELWCWRRLLSPLDCKEIQPVHPKGNPSCIFNGRTGTEAEIPILWLPDAKSWLIGKDPDAGKDWGQEKKGVTEDEMVGWHHWLNGHESEPALGDSEGGQGSLECCSPWGQKELGTTRQLKNSNKNTLKNLRPVLASIHEGFQWSLSPGVHANISPPLTVNRNGLCNQ